MQSTKKQHVQRPMLFNQSELDSRIETHLHHYHKLNSTLLLRAEHSFTFLALFQEAVLEGRSLVHDVHHPVLTHPFIVHMTKLPKETEQEIEDVKQRAEDEYRAEIEAFNKANEELLATQLYEAEKKKAEEVAQRKDEKMKEAARKEAAEYFASITPPEEDNK